MGLRFLRGVKATRNLSRVFFLISAISLLVALIQLASTWIRGGAPDHGWIAVVIVSLGLAFWSRKSQWLLRLFSDPGQAAHQNRLVMVWMLAAAVVILITGLKLGTADMDTYKRLVFGEGGLVEWAQVLTLATACCLAWQIGYDLRIRLNEVWASLVFRSLSILVGQLLLEELAWGQVIFGWKTPEALRELNAQNETTLHNIGWFQDRLDVLTFLATVAVLAIVVLVPWICKRASRQGSFERRALVRALMPASYTWPLFLFAIGIAYCVATRSYSDVIYNRDQEWGELVLYGSGLLLLLRTWVLLGPTEEPF